MLLLDSCRSVNPRLGREEGREETLLKSIRNIMNRFPVTVEEAMDTLGIPEGKYSDYLSKLKSYDKATLS